MNMYIYKQEIRGDNKVVVCLELKVTTEDIDSIDLKIEDSKIHKIKLDKNEKIVDHWNWVKKNKYHIFLVNNSIALPDKISSFCLEIIDNAISDMFLTDNKPLFLSLTRADLIEKYKTESGSLLYRVKMEENYILFKAFLYFTENPEYVSSFPIFEEFVKDNKLENYEIEDWLSDMEENILNVY